MENLFLRKYGSGLAIFLFSIAISFPMFMSILNRAGGSINMNENRTLAKFPDLNLTKEGITKFPKEFTSYFHDNFGARDALIKSHAYIKAFIFGESPVRNVILGKDGWLYLGMGNTTGNYGHRALSDAELKRWKIALEAKQKWLSELGIDYLFVIAPDKHSIYPEFMPERFKVEQADLPSDQLIKYLRYHSSVEVLDLRPALLVAKSKKPTYFKTDTHWNSFGGWVAYHEIIKRLSKNNLGIKLKSEDDYSFFEKKIDGQDLANMMGLRENFHEIEIQLYPKEKCARPVDLKLNSEFKWPKYPQWHEAKFFECKKEKLKAVVFQDSFGRTLSNYIPENFKETTFIWDYPTYSVIEAAVKQFKPDVIIEERVERHIKPMIPNFIKPLNIYGIWKSEKNQVEIKDIDGYQVNLINEFGSNVIGTLENSKLTVSAWGVVGNLSLDNKRIDWSNGTFWVSNF
jgi:alginate O-acetyltransferase complex protein AlgJ